jgi:RNA polymerase sigma-70 factor (ECF subfamily)
LEARGELDAPNRSRMINSVSEFLSNSNCGSSHGSATSRSLIARVQADEPDAWSRLVHLYAPLVQHWCRCRGLQDPDVADVFQDVFQSVVGHMGRFQHERKGDTFRGWLRRITQNKIHDHFRRRVREAPGVGGSSVQQRWAELPEPPVRDESLADDGEQELFARGLRLIQDEFEERTWKAFWRTAVDGREAKDVGAELAMSPGAVRVAKARVLRRLREELGDLTE